MLEGLNPFKVLLFAVAGLLALIVTWPFRMLLRLFS